MVSLYELDYYTKCDYAITSVAASSSYGLGQYIVIIFALGGFPSTPLSQYPDLRHLVTGHSISRYIFFFLSWKFKGASKPNINKIASIAVKNHHYRSSMKSDSLGWTPCRIRSDSQTPGLTLTTGVREGCTKRRGCEQHEYSL